MDGIRVNRLSEAIEYLKSNGMIHKQQDIAERMQADKSNVSRALSGDEKYLTDNFIKRFNVAFGNRFNVEWLIKGEGEMLRPEQNVSDVSGSTVVGANVNGNGNNISNNDASNIAGMIELQKGYQDMMKKSQEQIDRLLAVIERLTLKTE